jgi:hypothetical protein
MASLIHMQKILSSRGQHFPSIEKAVHNFGRLFICLLCKIIYLLAVKKNK